MQELTFRAKSGTVHRRAGINLAPLGIWVEFLLARTLADADRLVALADTPGITVQVRVSPAEDDPEWEGISLDMARDIRASLAEKPADQAELDLTGAWAKGFSIDADITVNGVVTTNNQNTEGSAEGVNQAAPLHAASTAESQDAQAATSTIPSQPEGPAGQEQTGGESSPAAPASSAEPKPAAKETAPKAKRPKVQE